MSVTSSICTISGLKEKPDKWEVDSTKLYMLDFIGEGEFGVVRKGWYTRANKGNFEVAIKMLKGK